MPTKVSKKVVGMIIRSRKTIMKDGVMTTSGIGEPSVHHALVVIFLEFFAWGLLTMPVISVLNETFPDHTFLMNGLIMGIKGLLSFLSAPLIGALSDLWGRKFFLLITVFFTCAPIPLMTINTWWFFAMISISGVFAVTFSVVFAYVADVTEEQERSLAYGLVSATFAASMVISPALGAYMMDAYSENLVVALATAIAILDVFFILVAVPESLPEKVRPSSWGAPISWEQADPFAALRKVGKDHTILMLCVTVFLSYLPEAGQYSCIFVYLKLVMGFSVVMVAVFIATVGILSVCAQIVLGFLMRSLGPKHTIMVGLVFEMLQLMWYGFGSQTWMMWAAGVLASVSSITYPAISAFVSMHSDADKQGLVQGMVTGMRGLCNGLGPAMFGVIFYLFHVDLNEDSATGHGRDQRPSLSGDNNTVGQIFDSIQPLVPGPPFVFGAFLVICALLVAVFIPDGTSIGSNLRTSSRRQSDVSSCAARKRDNAEDGSVDDSMWFHRPKLRLQGLSMELQYEVQHCKKHDGVSPLSPLVDNSAVL
ncbi:hippocampus abundant transcript 1 protein isoform X1 [Zootermopsis nevadensis]|uniref:Hippocampus abundant transcript 1 protein n=1 Tax=Zootermopsis nevadensis TaxID=136037 RepID=A0A067RIP5_ZOONE|nr:hippocampus abundant transcript 1 protein isoform X1 [Zootermopsis nevadensis]XP_021930129.1 hippocampus abundant transcript 1 protein isoform X1 [Zootermopsis nevadensis]KDR23637.1 Hippocampus abundant transcript 1 protein [Zootermopsis nevadensis]